ncbi:MAG: hypothetical protein ACEQSU_13995 [Microgenomates group bacterium]
MAACLRALNGGVPIRRKDGKLYALLAECLAICESVKASAQEPELRELVRVRVNHKTPENWGKGLPRDAGNAGRGKRFAYAASDAFILVCRYVLADVDGRNSHYRYAATLREAAGRGIAGADLVRWLRENGGVNALYRPTTMKSAAYQTRQLYLNQRITFPRSGEFTLTLRHDGKGFFDVVTA